MFRDKRHLETIISTAKEGARQTLLNILMLQVSNSRSQPSVKLTVEQIGEEDREYDILAEIAEDILAEDPFA
jgi:hypothetical protein